MVLILTKARYDYSEQADAHGSYGNPVGLLNGGAFLADGLREADVQAVHKSVVDSNAIDALVVRYKPRLVVLEALWVTSQKLFQLSKLHPTIKWVVRLHSNIPFLGMEGNAFQWSKELQHIKNVVVAANNEQTAAELSLVFAKEVVYLPNIYLQPDYCPGKGSKRHHHVLDISCFGAMRPFKNQLIQAVAAVNAADRLGKTLHFHINSSRVEQRGDTVLKNIQALFSDSRHKLIYHGWQPHSEFLLTVAKMDLGMQVSFTESFNIVAADHVHVGVPLVVSDEISWLSTSQHAKPTSVASISQTILEQLLLGELGAIHNKRMLENYNLHAALTWLEYLT